MHILCFVEEPSAEAALSNLLPRLLPNDTFQFIVFQGKSNLLNNLESRLRGYENWLPDDWRIIVLVDEDREECQQLKLRLEAIALRVGLLTKSQAAGGAFKVLNRIAVEELEAWFLGDIAALRQEFPRLPASLAKQRRFRDPDAITGGTWETLERLLQRYGYYSTGYLKIEAASRITLWMDPTSNRSHSFQVFIRGLQAL